ncbi:hypothetical protein PIB30_044515 [Stylosanthes scabra]|uniref:Zinc finger PHD-type domain-containing protein n=1 Tax=Stylosanthes scabra TaxID=79078 RepID=A0ABU6QG27_9FABA|nr:hypothetical protein [Stylosanthes scabra]
MEACRKRRRCPKIFSFHSFGDSGCPTAPSAAFRDNVRSFLRDCAELEDYVLQNNPLWCTLLVSDKTNLTAPLFTLEEQVSQSSHPFCDHCRSAGWSGHFVSKRRYHFIIPMDNGWNKPLPEDAIDNQGHLLHGVIHCNGYGHLVCINGIEGGSKVLSGREIMDLWDRICTNLGARKISVEDVSRKRSMDLRLLHGVAYGHSWFGRWGYKFCRGSFGVTGQTYYEAIEGLGSLELDEIMRDLSKTKFHKEIKQIIRNYRDMSETQITTLRDLLRFMLTVKSRVPFSKITVNYTAPSSSAFNSRNSTKQAFLSRSNLAKEKSAKYKKFSTAVANMDSRWPTRRLEFAAQVIVDSLKEHKAMNLGSDGMTRQDVRDASRLHIGDTGLLDYVLKSLNNVIVGNYVVRRMVNPSTRILEYTIHEVGNGFKSQEIVVEPEAMALVVPQDESSRKPGGDVYSDVFYLYKNVLLRYPNSETVDLQIQTILDSRHFVKEWDYMDEMQQVLTFICQLKPNFVDIKADLKRLIVTEITELNGASDDEVLFGLVQSGVELSVRGISIDLCTPLKFQGESDNWMVRCECGAQDDDGERMVACDICEVWQHTRCCGIDDSETVPPLFVCSSCCDSLAPTQAESPFAMDCVDDFLVSPEPTMFLEYECGY